jgi:hypothetical protein
MKDAYTSLIGIVTLIIGLALLAVVVKGNGAANLIQSFSSALDTLLSRSTGTT